MSTSSRRKLRPIAATLATAIALSACASTTMSRRDRDEDRDHFDAQAVAWSKKPGGNAIIGSAELTMRDQTKTCAGLEVRLVPDAPYTRERVEMLYGTTSEGYVEADEARRVQQRSDAAVDPAYKRSHKVTTCDGKGRFTFANLADGSYYVLAPVLWRKPGASEPDGGFLMQRVTLAGGETEHLHMTPERRTSSR
jgi:hypothetical protein